MKHKLLTLKIAILSCIALIACQENDSLHGVNPLKANAGSDTQAIIGNTVILDGSQSIDSEGETFSFEWTVKNQPANSNAELINGSLSKPSFKADKAGDYIIQLKIEKAQWESTDEIKVTLSEIGTQTIVISEDIIHDMVLNNVFIDDYQLMDYLITEPIQLKAKLTIMPGVRVAFAEDASLKITQEGTFISQGGSTEETRIYLTGKEEIPGFWNGIYIDSNKNNNKWNYTEMSYAGGMAEWSPEPIGLYLDENSYLPITNSFFNENLGIQVYYSEWSQIEEFNYNSMSGTDNNLHNIMLPITQVINIGSSNQILNGDIAFVNSILDNGENIVWPSYVYTSLDGIKLLNGTTLNIPEYTQIRVSENKRIDILNESRILAQGSQTGIIYFMGSESVSGYWKGIYIEHSGDNHSIFDFIVVKHAGSEPLAGDQAASFHLGAYGIASITNSSFNDGAGDGIEATSEGATILSFESNYVRGHQGYPIAVSTKNVSVLDYYTYFVNNSKNQVRVDGNYPIAFESDVIWNGFQQTNMTYHINGLGKDLTIWSGLRLMPGVVLEMEENSRIVVENANGKEGYLKAAGNATKPIIIKNILETTGSWYGITFSNTNTNNSLNYVHVLHGGKPVANSFSANIIVDNSPQGRLNISNSMIGYSGEHGISILNEKRGNLVESNITYIEIPGSNVYAW